MSMSTRANMGIIFPKAKQLRKNNSIPNLNMIIHKQIGL